VEYQYFTASLDVKVCFVTFFVIHQQFIRERGFTSTDPEGWDGDIFTAGLFF
jgi:hypothetical protein